jgi:hypothetical protein
MWTVIHYVARLVAFNYTTRKIYKYAQVNTYNPVRAALKQKAAHSLFGVKWLHGLLMHTPWTNLRIIHHNTTGCNRRNVRDFGRVFLRSNYTDITQNTNIQSWTVTEVMAIEMCGLLWCRITVRSRDVIHVQCACSATRHDNAVTLASALTVRQWIVKCKHALFFFPRGIFRYAFCVWILWWQCKCCCRRISKTLPRKEKSV